MPRFQYRALRQTGDEVAGDLVAESERDAAARLQAGGYYPIRIVRPVPGVWSRPRVGMAPRLLPARDLVLFSRQLGGLLGAGIVVDRALRLIDDTRRARVARLARDLAAAIERGERLSDACAATPALPPHYAMIIAAGEARGNIAEALDRLAAVAERSRATAQAVIGALAYPTAVLFVACVSVSFLLGVVVPRFAPLLTTMQSDPPLMMQILLLASAGFRAAALPLLAALVVVLGLGALRWREPRFRLALDRWAMHLPGIGRLLAKAEAERLAFVLGTLLGAGVELPAALAAARSGTSRPFFRDGLATVERAVERGDRVAAAFASSGMLPDMACELVRVGEASGRLAEMLLRAGDMLRRDVEATSAQIIALITPLSIVLLGLLIGAVAFGLLGAVLQIYDVAT